jgi:hypothetical protein
MSDQVPELFSMVVAAPDGINPLNHITLLDEELRGEIYWTNGEIGAVGIKEVLQTNIQMGQNYPNPFNTETTIELVLPQMKNLELQITNIEGRLIKEFRGNFEKGTHQIKLDRSFIKEEGVYYYTLKAGDFYATRKMIVID